MIAIVCSTESTYYLSSPVLATQPRLVTTAQRTLTMEKTKDHLAKPKARVNAFLEKPQKKVLFLKGAPGVGKTHMARELAGRRAVDFYEGEDEIEAWLEDSVGDN